MAQSCTLWPPEFLSPSTSKNSATDTANAESSESKPATEAKRPQREEPLYIE
jgi:hypothetical protein